MPYLGRSPQLQGAYEKADSIASQFNGVLVAFDIQVSAVSKTVDKAENLLVMYTDVDVNNFPLQQEPDGATGYGYSVSGSTITFATAPATGDGCWIVILGDVLDVASVGATSAIDDLTDVDTTTVAPTDGQVLTFVTATGKWEPKTPV